MQIIIMIKKNWNNNIEIINILTAVAKKVMEIMEIKKEITWTPKETKLLTIREEAMTSTKICILTNKIWMTSMT